MGNDSKSKNSFLEGGTMSHPVNDEILENLYEECFYYYSEKYPYWTEEKVIEKAELLAQKRFEDLSQ